MISAFSLQALIDISHHETLAPLLTHLVIGLDNLNLLTDGRTHLDTLTLEEYAECLQAANYQEYLLDNGGAIELLTQALVNLPNLKSIDIRTFNSRTRYRDNGSWTSYGHSNIPHWTRYINNGGLLSLYQHRLSSDDFARRVFKSLLTSLSRSDRPIDSLEFLARSSTSLPDAAFSLFPNSALVHHKLSDVLLQLTKLHIDLDLDRMSHLVPQPAIRTPNTAAEALDPASVNLRRFLTLTPNLTWLRMNFANNRSQNTGARLLTWLSLSPEGLVGWSENNPKPIAPPLRRLDLGNALFAPETVTRIFNKFNKLESCSFRSTLLRQEHVTGASDDDDDDDDFDYSSLWARIFRQMMIRAPNLKYLQLHHLREEVRGKRDDTVFAGEDETSWKHNIEISALDKLSLEALAKSTWRLAKFFDARRPFLASDSTDSEGSAENDLMSDDEDELDEDVPVDGDGDVDVDVDELDDVDMDV